MSRRSVYFVAAAIAICLIIFNQSFIQYWLYQKRADSELINVGGRQRMLSQRLLANVYALQIASSNTESNQDKIHQLITTDLADWEKAHQYLLDKLGNTGVFNWDKNSFEQLKALGADIEITKNKVATGISSAEELKAFKIHQDAYLKKMNEVVKQLEETSDSKLLLIIIVELLFALLSLIVIYYEINYVFKRINKDLSDQNIALKESNKVLEQYAFVAAHNFRSPVQNIINFTGLLTDTTAGKISEADATYLSYINSSANRMKQTTEELLQLAYIQQQELKIAACDMTSLIKHVQADLANRINETKAEFNINALPKVIQCDKHLMQFVVQHLLTNSLLYKHPDRAPVIDISYRETNDMHHFSFKDNGIGIDPNDQEGIFEMFKKLHNDSVYPGNGMGLAFCQTIMKKHKGSISIKSELEKGAEFIISLPKKTTV